MKVLNPIDRSKLFAELGASFRSHSAPFVTIVTTSGSSDEISAFCAEFSKKTPGTVYLEGEADSAYPFMVPYRPFFYAIYCSRPDYDNFREIDYNRVEKLAFSLGISSAAEKTKFSVFETMKSFYGFKHETKDSPARMKIFQEIASVFSYIARRGDIVFHVKNADKIDSDTAELINFICRNLKEYKISIILSHNSGYPIPEDIKKIFIDFVFGHHDFPCDGETVSGTDIFAAVSPEAALVLKASSIFYNDFRAGDIAACVEKSEKEVLPALSELAEKGLISESSYRGIFRHSRPRVKSDALKAVSADDFKKYNAAVLSRFSQNSIGIPDIGLSRLIYHALNIEDYATASAIASRLAISLCEVGCANNALKLIKFIEYIIFHKKSENLSGSLKSEIYIIHGQIYIILGKYERAFKFFSDLHERLLPLLKDNACELKFFDIQINKWLGLIALLKPSLPALKETVPLKYFTTAMALDVSSARNRIECNNLIALYNYQIGDLEKASIFYRDNVKMLSMEKGNQSLWLEADSTMRGLSSVCLRQGEFRKALAYIKKCEDACVNSGNKKSLANTYHYMGMIYHNRGDFSEAVSYYERGITVLEEISDKISQSRIWTSLGVTFFNQAKYSDALSYFNKSLEVAVRSNNKKAIAILNGNSARIYALLNNLDSAYAALKEDLAILTETRDRFGLAYAHAYLGDVHFMAGKTDEARESYKASYEISVKSQFLSPQILSSLGLLQCMPDELVAAEGKKLVEELLMIDSREIDTISKSLILRARAMHESACGIYHRATCFVNQALINFEKLNMPLETALCLIDEGKLLRLNNQADAARERIENAVKLFESIGARYYVDKYKKVRIK